MRGWLNTQRKRTDTCVPAPAGIAAGAGQEAPPSHAGQWQKVLWPDCVFCSDRSRVFEKNFWKRTQTVMRILVSRFIWFVPITGLCRAINISVLVGLVAFAITQTHSVLLWQIRFCCAFLFLKWFTNRRYWCFIILNSFNLVRSRVVLFHGRQYFSLFSGAVCYKNAVEVILPLQWLLGYSTVDPDPDGLSYRSNSGISG